MRGHASGHHTSVAETLALLAMGAQTVAGLAIYGTGQDPVGLFNGVNVFPYAVKVGNVYRLTQETYLPDGSIISPAVTVRTAGFRLFCDGTLVNNGVIECNGEDAVGGTGGLISLVGNIGSGLPGGNGGVNGVGSPGTNQPNGVADAAAAGEGVGGAGGAGGVNGGGLGGTYADPGGFGGSNFLVPALLCYTLGSVDGINIAAFLMGGGAGGGGGGSDNGGVTGGGGGGGGGVMGLYVYNLVNNGVIRAAGGKGADAAGAGGNGGGGAGGGGGLINSVSRYRSGVGSVLVPGGLGGAKIGAGGVAGLPGALGHINALTA